MNKYKIIRELFVSGKIDLDEMMTLLDPEYGLLLEEEKAQEEEKVHREAEPEKSDYQPFYIPNTWASPGTGYGTTVTTSSSSPFYIVGSKET